MFPLRSAAGRHLEGCAAENPSSDLRSKVDDFAPHTQAASEQRENTLKIYGLSPESQNQNLALTVLYDQNLPLTVWYLALTVLYATWRRSARRRWPWALARCAAESPSSDFRLSYMCHVPTVLHVPLPISDCLICADCRIYTTLPISDCLICALTVLYEPHWLDTWRRSARRRWPWALARCAAENPSSDFECRVHPVVHQRLPSGLDCLICGLDCLISGLDCLIYGLDCLISGLDCLSSGLDCLIWHLEEIGEAEVALGAREVCGRESIFRFERGVRPVVDQRLWSSRARI